MSEGDAARWPSELLSLFIILWREKKTAGCTEKVTTF